MHRLESSILGEFKREPSKVFSTTEMVREIFKNEYAVVTRYLHSSDPRRVRRGHIVKAQLHRKLLYHINKLVQQQLLSVSGVRGKGEKLFQLALDEGELIIQDRKSKIVIAKTPTITTAIDGYEREGIIRKFKPEAWLNKQNSIFLEAEAFTDIAQLQQRLQEILPVVSDVIALNHVEALFQRSTPEEAEQFLKYLSIDAQDYNIGVSLLIDIARVEQQELMLHLINHALSNCRKIRFIFEASSRLLSNRREFFNKLFTLFSEAKKKLTIKNTSLAKQPIYFGRAGAYAFSSEDWNYYEQHIKGKGEGCALGHIGLTIDIQRFLNTKRSLAEFRDMVMRSANTFFEIEERRRREFTNYFTALQSPSLEATKLFFRSGRSYIRFWNYDWEDADAENLLDLLTSIREDLDIFAKRQETIFRSCGLPIRFSLGMSTSFAKFDQDFLSERRYTKTVVSGVKDLQKMKRYLRVREKLYKVFDGADRLRFFLSRKIPMGEVHQITRYLLSAYDLPSFTLDFRGKSGEMKLTSFMES